MKGRAYMAQNTTPRVLITYVEAGMGHIVTAQAISDSLKSLYGDRLEIIDNYTLRDSSNPSLPKYEKFLVNEVKSIPRSTATAPSRWRQCISAAPKIP